jgi:hypothetical protein
MSYVDHIIKYLSGELSREESGSFEKELESNPALKKAFEDYSAAYHLIGKQLRMRDQNAFEARLKEAMEYDVPPSLPRRNYRRLWYLPPAIACLLAMVLIIGLPPSGNERIFSRYYHPAKDPVLNAYYQETRGKSEPGINQYRLGNYNRAMELLSLRISEDRENKLIQLYYLLSAVELNRQGEVLVSMARETALPVELVDQSISWYAALALIKSERRKEALDLLQALADQKGPYQSRARKLKKVLLK